MNLITIDFETFYSADIGFAKQTTEEYVRDKEFEIIGVAVKVNKEEAQWASGTHEELKGWLKGFDWENSMALAHNVIFDGFILNEHFDIRPKFWVDTLCMGRAIHGVEVSGSLAALAERYGLGKKGTEVQNFKGYKRKDFQDWELSNYGDYCINDVNLTHALFHKMIKDGFPKKELHVINQTVRMFTEPVLELDTALLTEHLTDIQTKKEKLLEEVGLDKEELLSNQKFAAVLKKLNVEPPTKISPTTGKPTLALAKNDEEFKALAEHPDVRVQALVAARLGTKSTLEETRTQRFLGIASRGKLPVPIKYYAAHTGRFGGDDKINLQNLPSRGANANKLKKAILAPQGYTFIDADSAQIEARVLAWLSGQDDLVQAFTRKDDVYKNMASAIYGKSEDQITKDERFVGKTTILGCFGADTKVLTDSGWKRIVEIQTTDMVWDGEEWVKHQGVVPKGVRETITAYGIDATPEHEILTEHGWREWYEVVTNHTLFQSALSKANLPSSIGHNTAKKTGALRDGTQSFGAHVDGRVKLTAITSNQSERLGAIPARKFLVQKLESIIGGMKRFSLMNNIVPDYLTEFHRVYQDAITPVQKFIRTMGVGVSLSTTNGALTAQRFSNTYSRSKVGKTLLEKLTDWMSMKDTNREILGLQQGLKTCQTVEKQKICKRKLMTYDIAYAGPRNRFTIATDAGVLIVHNCGYGMGAVKFQAQLKSFNVTVTLDEARRIIDIYRRTNPAVTTLWKQAQLMLMCMSRAEACELGRRGVLTIDPWHTAIKLPSGLLMRYTDLKYSEGEQGLEFSYKTRYGRTRIYGGKVIENVCQAIARCIIAEQMLRIGKQYRVVLTVHDAIGCIVKDDEVEVAQKYVEDCMRWVPEWAEGLPVNCESGMGKSYGDC